MVVVPAVVVVSSLGAGTPLELVDGGGGGGGGAVVDGGTVVVGGGGAVVVLGVDDFVRVAAQIATPNNTSKMIPPTTAAMMIPPFGLGVDGGAGADPTDAEPVAVIPDISSCLIDKKFILSRWGCRARRKSFGFPSSWHP